MGCLLGFAALLLVAWCVVRAARTIRDCLSSRWPWFAFALLVVIQIILHCNTTAFLADIAPSTAMAVNPHTLRYSYLWGAVLSVMPFTLEVWHVAVFNNALGVLMLFPLFSFLLGFWRHERVALVSLAFAVFAITPLKFISSEGQFALLLFCATAGADRLLCWLGSARRSDLFLAAACLSCAANLRPEGFLVVASVALLILLKPARLKMMFRPLNLLLIALPVSLVALGPFVGLFREALGGTGLDWFSPNPLHYLAFAFYFWPEGFFASSVYAAFMFGLTLMVARRMPALRLRLLLLVLMIGVVSFGMARPTTYSNERYLVTAVLLQWVFVGAVVYHGVGLLLQSWSTRRRQIAQLVVCAVGLSAAFLAEARLLDKKWAHTAEYTFLIQTLEKLPDGSTILADLFWEREAGLEIHGNSLSMLVDRRHEWLDFKDLDSLADLEEAYFYLGGSCRIRQRDGQGGLPYETFSEFFPKCRAALESLQERGTMELLYETRAPGRSLVGGTSTRKSIPIELYHFTADQEDSKATAARAAGEN